MIIFHRMPLSLTEEIKYLKAGCLCVKSLIAAVATRSSSTSLRTNPTYFAHDEFYLKNVKSDKK